MRKLDVILKEYVSQLVVDNLKFLSLRLDQRIGSDLAEALDAVSECQEIDKWLASAKSCDEFYNMIDTLQEYVDRELNKRSPELQMAG